MSKHRGYHYRLTIRATKTERKHLGERAKSVHLSVSRYLVEAALTSANPPTPESRAERERLLFQLRKVGVNLNQLAQRRARVAAALLRFGEPALVWPLLRHSDDPRERTYLIHQLAALHVDPRLLIRRYRQESDVSVRRALLLGLGTYRPEHRDEADPERLAEPFREAVRFHWKSSTVQ